MIKKDYHENLDKSRLSEVTQASYSDLGPAAYFTQQEAQVKNASFSKSKRFKKVKK